MSIHNSSWGTLGWVEKHDKARHRPEIVLLNQERPEIEKPPGKELSPIQDCEWIVVHSTKAKPQ